MKKIAFLCLLLIGGICAAETLSINVMGYGAERSTVIPVNIEWDDKWFEPFSEPKYNHKLARAAGALCAISYVRNKNRRASLLAQAYEKLGVPFESVDWSYDIDYGSENYGINQAAFSLGKKKLPSGRDLVFVVIRGTPGNEEEWLSNINVWNSLLTDKRAKQGQYHEGFLGAVTKVMGALENYAQTNNIDLKKASLLITGHSRGAAASNLLSALLADQEKVSPDRVFAYTFATPNVTIRDDAHDPKYDFIFNIVNGEDIVPTVPPCENKWRYTKFGITKTLINSWNCDDIKVYQNEYIPKMNALYTKFLGREYHPFNTGTFIPSKIADSFAMINPTPRKFYKSWFSIHKRLSKTIISEFPSTMEQLGSKNSVEPGQHNDESVTGIRRLFDSLKKRVDTKTKVLMEYSLTAFIDMHAMQSYLSWLLALDELSLFSERQSSIVRIKGIFNGAIVDADGNVYAHIYDGILHIRETKAPLAAWQIPFGNFGPISLGFPHSENYSLLIYRDSLIPTPVRVTIERYAADGTFLGVISKKCASPCIGSVVSFDVGRYALERPNGSPASCKRLTGTKASVAIKDGKLKNTDVSHMNFEIHMDTERFVEVGMTSGLQKFYLATLVGFNSKNINDSQSFSLGVGTQHCFCGPIMLNAEAYARFVRYTSYSFYNELTYSDKWAFALVPSTRFMLSIKPAKRIQFFSALELSYHIQNVNDNYFYSENSTDGLTPWYINDSLSIEPSIQFGLKL